MKSYKISYCHFILLALIVILNTTLNAQVIKYAYDESGNRVSRQLIVIPISPSPQYSSIQTKPDSLDVNAQSGKLIIDIYPNPTKGDLAIRLKGLTISEKVEVRLFDSHGSLLQRKDATMGLMQINMSALPAGWYILQATGNKHTQQFKVIKE